MKNPSIIIERKTPKQQIKDLKKSIKDEKKSKEKK